MKNLFNNSLKMDEIIFANRNKQYGAYTIRASYNSTILKSLSYVISFVLLLSAGLYTLTHSPDENSNHQDSGLAGYVSTSVNIMPIEKPKILPRNNSVKPPKSNAIPTVIKDSVNSDNRNNVIVTTIIPDGDPNGNPNVVVGTGTAGTTGNGLLTQTLTIQEQPTAFPVEEPEFEGGLKALRDFISKNLSYPNFAREIGKEGTVFVTFIIDEKGQVENTSVLKGIGAGCDEEAVRVVSKIPKFKKPGKNAIGKPVKVIFNIPIAFRIR